MAALASLPPISSLRAVDDGTLKSVLDVLFEPSPEIHSLVIPKIRDPNLPLASYASLIEYIGSTVSQLTQSPTTPEKRAKLHGILGSHPRLGARKVESAQSQAEQAHLNVPAPPGSSKEEEAARLQVLNEEYEARFPGLRYVVFVNGRSRDTIMQDMRERIDRGDIAAEEKEAIQAIVNIALDRASKFRVLTN
ncbi:Oxo-4-hydroxy-4-carboxy-5-ureidoimidazoline decarboxylase [Durotheca rogersii]|uniref:Oxo-4-hydroxy-4-carboxy-5-ureidoimidazoline decarboxylase n=1 Tax=Durotheca rogersii TaxID=419775 RepID=UPI00221F69F4|nr:Oxo-4-hydroxy-4-carboxy-5-ureidoimidazoline decarboxylase [Durotheca rogersii]KAI5860464.1 Oxo-4-hydroxy-4-carboxy-5-ureidoimidazoline decarboxylase [Durotheca rogersii]